jgi:uncharacterized membrane protein
VDGIKGFLQSKTVWAALVGLIATILQKNGYTFGEAEQSALIDQILNGVQLVSYVLAAYFRVKATKVVSAAPVVK